MQIQRAATTGSAATRGGGGGGGGGGNGAMYSQAALLLEEVDREMVVFKGLDAVVARCEEALASLVSRLQSRKVKMGKKKKAVVGAL